LSTTVTRIPERGGHRRVLHADHAGAHDRHRLGHAFEPEEAVRVDHGAPVEVDTGRTGGGGADRDHDARAAHELALNLDGVGIDERGGPGDRVDVVSPQLVANDHPLVLDDAANAPGEVVERDVVLHPVRVSVDAVALDAGEVEDCGAKGLRRDRPGVRAHASEIEPALDDRDTLPELRRLDRCALPARARPDHQEVVVAIRVGHCRTVGAPGRRRRSANPICAVRLLAGRRAQHEGRLADAIRDER
jgi:hypothetical protein